MTDTEPPSPFAEARWDARQDRFEKIGKQGFEMATEYFEKVETDAA
jgi:hypothetical protein